MEITATVLTNGANVHGRVRTNTASLASTTEEGTDVADRTATSDVYIVEPSPAPLKTADNTEPRAGEAITYTVTARNLNTGNLAQQRSTLHDAVLVDCVPAGLVVRPASLTTGVGSATVEPVGSNGCAAGRTPVVWQVGDLGWRSVADAGGADPWPTLTYVVDVDPAAGGAAEYTNVATLTGTSMDGVVADEKSYSATAQETVIVPGGALTKSVDEALVPVGGLATYDLEIALPQDVNFYDATVIDQLPAGIAPASVVLTGSTCTYADVAGGACGVVAAPGSELAPVGQLHGWFLGDVPADARPRTVTVTYTAVVGVVPGNVAGTPLRNSAVLRWNQVDQPGTPALDDTFDAATDESAVTVTVTEPSLSVDKVVDLAAPQPGQTFTYTVRITNATGAAVSAAHDVDLVDTVPAGVQVVGTPDNGGVAAGGSPGGGTVTWSDLGPIAPGATLVLTYQARLVSPAPDTAQVNVADITEYTSLDDADGSGRSYDGPSDDATVAPALPVIDVVKTVLDPAPAYLGEPTRWQIEVTNSGTATAYDVDVEDVLPTGWLYDTDSARVSLAGGPAAARNPDTVTGSPVQTLTWDDLGDLAVGETLLITFGAVPQESLAPAGVGSGVAQVNAASATAQDLDGAAGSVVTDDSDTAQTRIDAADVTILKEAVGIPVAGSTFTWRITVTNDGPDLAVGPFTVTDDLPPAVTGASATGTGWTCSTALATVTCDRTTPIDSLASGDPFPVITLTALVPAGLTPGTALVNEASVEARTYELDPSDNSSEVSVDSIAVADLGIVKALVGDLVPGAEATYTIDVTNSGPSVARGPIVVTDTLPAGLSYVSFSGTDWDLDRAGQELTFTWAGATPVPVGALPQISIVVGVDSAVAAPVTNAATVTEPTDPTTGPEAPDSSSVTTSPTPSADLAVTKSSPGRFLAGTRDFYELVVSNGGPSDDAGPIRVVDTLPAGLDYVDVTSTEAWSCSAVVRVVTCTLPAGLTADASSTLRLAVDIAETTTGDLVNTAVVSSPTADPNPGNDEGRDDTGVTVEADLVVTKTVVTDPVVAGEPITYEIRVRNEGPATSPGTITVTDRLAPELELVSVGGTGWTCTGDRDLVCDRTAALPDGQTAGVITVVADVASSAGGVALVNSANVAGPATDPVPDNTSTVSSTVGEDTELVVTKSVNAPTTVRAGENASFSIVVDNTGSSDARSVVVADVLPAGMTLVSVSGAGWSCIAATCSRDRIVAQTSAPELTVLALVGSAVPDGTVLTNEVTVSTVTPGDLPAGNTDDADVTIAAEADLELVKTHPTGAAIAGAPTSFELRVSNLGPSVAVGPLVVSDQLPAGMTYLSAGAPWSCVDGAELVCSLPGDLAAPGTAPALTIQVMVGAGVSAGLLTNTARVDSSTTDPVPGNDADSADVTVSRLADLSVTKTHDGTARVGDPLTFTLQVSNAGPSTARDVVLADPLPEGLTLVSAEGVGWTCDVTGGEVSCTLDDPLPPLADAEPVTVVATVTPAAYPSVANVGTVSGSTPDADPDDNTSTDTVPVPPLVDLSITKTLRGTLVVGETATYELVVTNQGPTPAPGPITISDPLPTGLRGVSAQGDGWACDVTDAAVTCVRADALGVGDSTTVELEVEVLPEAYPSVVNTADVSSPAEEQGLEDNSASAPGEVTPTVDLTLDKELVSVKSGRVAYLLSVTNQGPSDTVSPVKVRDALPGRLTLVSAKGRGWSCSTQPDLVSCVYAGVVEVGATVSIRLLAEIDPDADDGSEIVNTAVQSGGGDPDRDHDSASFTVPDDGVSPSAGNNLPDTGGPAGWLVLLSMGLTMAGGTVLIRRRAHLR